MLIIGLGNYGKEYENTRHNTGFMAIDCLAEKLGVKISVKECKSLTGKAYVNGKKTILAKPQTYMNLSGLAAKELCSRYNVPISELVVISDDIDLNLGAIRIRKTGSAGTHNGLKNIIEELGERDFVRFRIGVGAKKVAEMDLKDYVLSKFSKAELKEMEASFEKVAEAIEELLQGRPTDIVMGKYNDGKRKENAEK